MIVVIDTSVLLALLDPSTPLPPDPETNQPITHSAERISCLIKRLEKSNLIVPTPVLTEILARAKDATPGYLDTLRSQKAISLAAFDQRAAIEAGFMLGDILTAAVPANQEKRAVKFDIQILAIAKVNGADQLISTDENLLRRAGQLGITAIHLSKLPLPPAPPQLALALPQPEENTPAPLIQDIPPAGAQASDPPKVDEQSLRTNMDQPAASASAAIKAESQTGSTVVMPPPPPTSTNP